MDIRSIFLSFFKFLYSDGAQMTIGVLEIPVPQGRQLVLEVV